MDDVKIEDRGAAIRAEDVSAHLSPVEQDAPFVDDRESRAAAVAPAGEKVLAWIVTVIMFLLPVFFIPTMTVSLEFSKYIFLAGGAFVAFLAWLAFRLKDGTFSFPKSVVLLAGTGIVVAYALGAARAPGFWHSFSGLLYDRDTVVSTIALFLLMFLASVAIRTRARAFYAYSALFLSGALIALFQLPHIFFPSALTLGAFSGIGSNMIGKWNDVGVFFGLIALLGMLTIELMQPKTILKSILATLLAVSVALLVLINFSTVWYLLALFSLGFLGLRRLGSARSTMPVSAFALAGISVLFAVSSLLTVMLPAFALKHSWINVGGSIVDTLGIAQVEVRPSWQSTSEIMTATLKQSPLLGAGPNRFANQWALYKSTDVNSTIFWDTEFQAGIGLIPSFIVTTGILGALAWLFFFGLFLYRGGKTLFAKGADAQGQYFLVSSFLGALYLWLVAFFYVPSTVPFALAFIMTGIWLGCLAAEHILPVAQLGAFATQRRGFLAVLVILIVMMASVVSLFALTQKSLSIIAFQKGKTAFAAGNLSSAESHMSRAIRMNPQDIYYRSLTQIDMAEIQVLLATTSKTVTPDEVRSQFQTLYSMAIDNAQKAVAANTTNATNYLLLGDVYASVVPLAVSGGYESAQKSYGKAAVHAPKSPLVPLSLARLEVAKGNIGAARTAIAASLTLKPNYTDARFLLAQIEASQGNTSKATEQIAQAASLDPNNVGLLFQLGLLYYNTKDYEKVVPVLERAVALNNQYSNARYFLGLSYWKLGKREQAIAQFKVIEQFNPENTEVKQILANMNAGVEPFASVSAEPPEKRSKPPVDESKSKSAKAAKSSATPSLEEAPTESEE